MSGESWQDEGLHRLSKLLGALIEAGLEAGDNPVIVQDEDGAEYKIVDVNHDTGDIAIVLEAPPE